MASTTEVWISGHYKNLKIFFLYNWCKQVQKSLYEFVKKNSQICSWHDFRQNKKCWYLKQLSTRWKVTVILTWMHLVSEFLCNNKFDIIWEKVNLLNRINKSGVLKMGYFALFHHAIGIRISPSSVGKYSLLFSQTPDYLLNPHHTLITYLGVKVSSFQNSKQKLSNKLAC